MRQRDFVWLDVLAAVGAAVGLTTVTLYKVNFRASDYAASDFKTLYASIWCYMHGTDAYRIPNLQRVFNAGGVIQPARWYGHAPVYPWTTLALGSPVCVLGMEAACYAAIIISGILLALAMFALARYGAKRFDLGPLWRLAIPGLCAAGPLVAFGMGMGNVSVAASALCFLAFAWRDVGTLRGQRALRWLPACALAVAFLLKPHLALWAGLGMALLPERAGRAVALRGVAIAAAFTALTAAAMAACGTLTMQTQAYLAVLRSETGVGASMSAGSREVLPVVSQITSLDSIVGFWTNSTALRVGVTFAVLLSMAFLLWRQTRRVNSERGALLAVGAWCAFGTLATYHRAHDAALILLLVPWIVDRVRRNPLAWHAWVITASYCAMSLSANFDTVRNWVAGAATHSLIAFLLLRQAGLADLLLVLAVGAALVHENTRFRAGEFEISGARDVRAAA